MKLHCWLAFRPELDTQTRNIKFNQLIRTIIKSQRWDYGDPIKEFEFVSEEFITSVFIDQMLNKLPLPNVTDKEAMEKHHQLKLRIAANPQAFTNYSKALEAELNYCAGNPKLAQYLEDNEGMQSVKVQFICEYSAFLNCMQDEFNDLFRLSKEGVQALDFYCDFSKVDKSNLNDMLKSTEKPRREHF